MFFELQGVPKWSPNDSQNGANMGPKSSSGAGGLRESLRERFWRVLEGPRGSPEAPQERPRSAQERPRRPNMTPRRPNMSPRRPQMTPRRVKMSPRRAKVSSGRSRAASGSDLERISEAFSSNGVATETLPTQTAGEGA